MASLIFKVDNAAPLVDGEVGTVTGKNGFFSRLGSIPLWCNSYQLLGKSGQSNGYLRFTLQGLNHVLDVNFTDNRHVLYVANSYYDWSRGNNFVDVALKPNSQGIPGTVGYVTDEPYLTTKIIAMDLPNNTIDVNNESSGVVNLFDLMDSTPFQVKLRQIINSAHMNANIAYVEGTYQVVTKVNNPFSNSVATEGTGIIGRGNAIDTTAVPVTANQRLVQKYRTDRDVYVTRFYFYQSPRVSLPAATGGVRGIIYSCAANGNAVSLLAQSQTKVAVANGWNYADFDSPILIPSGNIALGIHANISVTTGAASGQNLIFRIQGAIADTFSDGAATTWTGTTMGTGNTEYNFYVTYTYNSATARSNAGYYTQNVGVTPSSKRHITVYRDGYELAQSDFIWEEGTPLVNIPLGGNDQEFRTYVKRYHLPTLEVGDWLWINGQNSAFQVAQASYIEADPSYNAVLTSNSIYRINLSPNINGNVSSGAVMVNVTPDLEGLIGDISTSTNSFSLFFDGVASTYSLADQQLYRLESPLNFFPYTLSQDAVLSDLPLGTLVFRSRNVSQYGVVSPWVTKTVFLLPIPIQRVQNLTISEILYNNTSDQLGVMVQWDLVSGQDVNRYELSYSVDGVNTVSPVTVTVPQPTGTATRVQYRIDNLPRGPYPGANKITVQVTPLTSNNTRGLVQTAEKDLMGRVEKPEPVDNFSVQQIGSQLFFSWNYRLNSSGTLVSQDTVGVEIRQLSGTYTETSASLSWNAAPPFAVASVPATSTFSNIITYGTYTYVIRAKNSSGLYSDVRIFEIATTGAPNSKIWKAWNEDTPATQVISGQNNENASEYNFASMLAINNGVVYATSNAVDNANGSAVFWSYVSGDNTSIQTNRNTKYYTQIRDLGANVRARILLTWNGAPEVNTAFNSLYSVYHTGTTINSGNSTILRASGIGTILGFGNASAATTRFDANNKTLMSGAVNGNVWAIWNPGQFNGDISNANSFAYIARIINADAVGLGGTFKADGTRTFTNALANLTTAASNFYLVDLKQFIDNPVGQTTFDGAIDSIRTNIRFRTSCTSPYYANGNVADTTGGLGTPTFIWLPYNAGERRFRYLQVSFAAENDGTANGVFVLDQFRYMLESTVRSCTQTVAIASTPQAVDYSAMDFGEVPDISLTMLTDGGYSATIVNSSRQGANINVYNNVGVAVTGVNVSFRATGV